MLGRIRATVGKPLELQGYADDFDRAIVAIEFSLDEGATWTRHDTAGAVPGKMLTWHFAYTPERPGLYRLLVRAVNERGERSPLSDSVEFEAVEES